MVAEAIPGTGPFLPSRVSAALVEPPDPEVVARPTRRTFTVEYKLRLIAEADACAESKQIGALLRREGLYSSHLATWRRQHAAGGRAALTQPRGRKPADPTATELTRLQQENARLTRRLAMAEEIIAVQKKVAHLLGLTLAEPLLPWRRCRRWRRACA
jgi:transposase